MGLRAFSRPAAARRGHDTPVAVRFASSWQRASAALARPADWALHFEVAYALPAIGLLVLHVTEPLLRAWGLERSAIAGVLRLDRGGWAIGFAVALPFLGWLTRLVRHGVLVHPTAGDLGAFLYLFGALLGFAQTIAQQGSTTRLLGIAGAVFLYYVVSNTALTARSLARWTWGLLGATVVLALLSLSLSGLDFPQNRFSALVLAALAALRGLVLGPPFHLAFFEMAQRLVVAPNGVADLFVLLAILPLALAFGARSVVARLAWLAVTAIALLLLLATESRTAYIGLFAAWLTMAWLAGKRRLVAALLVAGFVGVSTLVPFDKVRDAASALLARDMPRFEQVVGSHYGADWKSDASTAGIGRLRVWSAYWELVRILPVRGAGLGLFSVANEYAIHYDVSLYYTDPHSHNVLLQTYLEQTPLGLVGLGLLTYAVWRTLRLGLRHTRSAVVTQSHRADLSAIPIAVGAWGAIVGFLVHGLFDINVNTNVGTALLFALFALAQRGALIAAGSEHPLYSPSRRLAAAWLAALLFGVIIFSLFLPPFTPAIHTR